MRPDKAVRIAESASSAGAPHPALASAAGAITEPDELAIVDEIGTLTFGADRTARSNALARALRERGVGEGDGVAIMCRNHRYFIEATMACAKLGAVALYLNTAFAARSSPR